MKSALYRCTSAQKLERAAPSGHIMVMHTRVWQAIELHGEHDQAVPGTAAEVTAWATALLEVTFLNSAVDCVGEAIARRTKCKQLGDA